jgi:galactose mutarotase-like enzyme
MNIINRKNSSNAVSNIKNITHLKLSVLLSSILLTLVNNNVTITKEFFDKDALIVENSGIKKVSLSKDCEPVVEVMFNAPVFGLWSAAGKGVPFVCIEPWYGRTDAIDSDGSLDAREWGNELAGGETFTGGYRCKFL